MPTIFNWSKTIAELPGNPVPADWLAANGDGVKVAYIDRGVNLGLASLALNTSSSRRVMPMIKRPLPKTSSMPLNWPET
jgi:hypothetical protein